MAFKLFVACYMLLTVFKSFEVNADEPTNDTNRQKNATLSRRGRTVSLDDIQMILDGTAVKKKSSAESSTFRPRNEGSVLDIHPTPRDAVLPIMLKFHVSGQIDARYALELTNYKFPKKLMDFSRILDAQLTKMLRLEKVHSVHMNHLQNNTDHIAFTSTIYFEQVSRVNSKSLETLIRDDDEFKASDVYVFEYCTMNTCRKNGECQLIKGSAACRCKVGFHKDRCLPVEYSDKDYYTTGALCGVVLLFILILLGVFCRNYKFSVLKSHRTKRHDRASRAGGSSIHTGHSPNINSYQFTSYLKRGSNSTGKKDVPITGFPTYRNMEDGVIPLSMPGHGSGGRGEYGGGGVQNPAFVVENSGDSSASLPDSIYTKQLRKFFEEAPQMRLNNAMLSRSNSFNEHHHDVSGGHVMGAAHVAKKQNNNTSAKIYDSPPRGPKKVNGMNGNDIRTSSSRRSRFD